MEKNRKYYKLIPKQEGLPRDIKIEKEFLKPVIKSPRECEKIILNYTKNRLLMCYESKSKLKDKKLLSYIKWGENKKFNRIQSVKNRKLWYSVPDLKVPDVVYPLVNNDKPLIVFGNGILFDANFTTIFLKNRYKSLIELFQMLNLWSFIMLSWELFGISNLGGGAIKQNPAYMKYVIVPRLKDFVHLKNRLVKIINKFSKRPIHSIFTELGFDPSKSIREQEPKPLSDRAELDKIIFDELDLTEEERKEVYWAVAELVKQRLEKARSLKRGV